MSITIAAKVYDGFVFGADSAVTVVLPEVGDARSEIVYSGGTKVFNLHRELPLAAVTVGLAHIGSATMPAIMKGLRALLMGVGGLDPTAYTVEQVADIARRYLTGVIARVSGLEQLPAPLCIQIAGYGTGEDQPEQWELTIPVDGQAVAPRCIKGPTDYGLWWAGAAEPVTRLLYGYSPALAALLTEAIDDSQAAVPALMEELKAHLQQPLVLAQTPLSDVIELVTQLVELAKLWQRLTPGPAVVGGEVELATVTRYEGYKWVRRKHYYPTVLNPRHLELGDAT